MSDLQIAVKKIVQYLVFAFSCLIGLMLFSRFVLMGFKQTKNESLMLRKGWDITINKQVYRNVDIREFSFPSVSTGDVIVLKNRLPPCPWENPVIRVDAWYCLIDSYINGRQVFSYGYDLAKRHKNVGTGYHVITPEKYVPGSELTIVLHVMERDAFSKLQPVCVDKAGTTLTELWKERGFDFGSSIFFIIVGILLVVIGGAWSFRDRQNLRLLHVGFSSLFLGLVSFYDNDCAVLFSSNYSFNTWANHISLYGANISLLVLVYTSMTQRYLDRLIIKTQFIFFMVYALLVVYLDGHGIIHLVSTRSIMMTLFGLEVIVATGICLMNILVQSKEYRIPSIGFLCMIGFIGIDLVRYTVVKRIDVDTTNWNGTMVCLGAMVFLISVFVNFYKEYAASSKKLADSTVLKQYKAMDYDTGLLAPAAKPEILEIMRSAGINQYSVVSVVLDIDEYIQCQSPMVIENMIWAFAHALQNSFRSRSYIFRKSETVFEILLAADRKTLDESLDCLKQEVLKARQPSMSSDYKYTVEISLVSMSNGLESHL